MTNPRLSDLRDAYATGNLIVYAGAGISAAAGLPTWPRLAEGLRARLAAEHASPDVLAEIDEYLKEKKLVDALSAVKHALGAGEFNLAIEKACNDKGRDVPEVARAIASLSPKLRAVLTTNLDRFLERAFAGAWPALTQAPGDLASRRKYILKFHGTLIERQTWVFSRDQYDQAVFGSPTTRATLEALFHTCPLLFVGCGLEDDDLDQTFAAIRALSGGQPPMHFALVAAGSVPPFRRRTLEAAGLRLIEYDNADGKHAELPRLLRTIAGVVAPAPPAPPPPAVSPARAASGGVPATVAATSALPPGFAFPHPLVEAHQQGKLAVLFGSGLSVAKDVEGNFPLWSDLPGRLLDQTVALGVCSQEQADAMRGFFKPGYVSLEVMLTGLDMLKQALRGARKYRQALTALFRPRGAVPGDVHRALVELGVNVLLTTNYDELLEAVEGPPARRVYSWRESDKALDDILRRRKVLFKIHGNAEDDDSIVMTRAEYEVAAKDPAYQSAMRFLLQTYTFLLVGYGVNDPLDLDLLFELNTDAFGSAAKLHYALVKDAAPTDRDRWQRDMNVQVVPYADHADLPAILRALRTHP